VVDCDEDGGAEGGGYEDDGCADCCEDFSHRRFRCRVAGSSGRFRLP
jgi:hypothetical protein